MDNVIIYHNALCSKSCSVVEALAEKNLPVEIIEYLKTPPTREELITVIEQLGIPAEALIRKHEDEYKQFFHGKTLSEETCIEAMIAHPILIERPIVVRGKKAVIGRPIERVFELLHP